MCNGARKILWPRPRQSHNPALDVAMVWSSLWVTGLRALGAKSVIYDCLVTIAPLYPDLCPLLPPYVRILAPPVLRPRQNRPTRSGRLTCSARTGFGAVTTPLCSTVFFHNLSPSFLWSTSWPGTLHFIRHTFLHPIIVFFSQHMPIPSQPVPL